ncbi:MAG TPA: hypothetical protein VGA53_04435 [Candidatus Paceibacterota bacterium]
MANIQITLEDIQGGNPEDCYRHPVALALYRQGYEPWSVELYQYPAGRVGKPGFTLQIGGTKWGPDRDLESWLWAYDRGEDVSPIAIVLDDGGAHIANQ